MLNTAERILAAGLGAATAGARSAAFANQPTLTDFTVSTTVDVANSLLFAAATTANRTPPPE